MPNDDQHYDLDKHLADLEGDWESLKANKPDHTDFAEGTSVPADTPTSCANISLDQINAWLNEVKAWLDAVEGVLTDLDLWVNNDEAERIQSEAELVGHSMEDIGLDSGPADDLVSEIGSDRADTFTQISEINSQRDIEEDKRTSLTELKSHCFPGDEEPPRSGCNAYG